MSEFHIAFELNAKRSVKSVSEVTLMELLRNTQRQALGELDGHYGGDSWCSEIEPFASIEGPSANFILKVGEQPSEDQVAMIDRVAKVFERHWDALIAQLP